MCIRDRFFHAPVPLDTTADNFDFKQYLHESVGAEFEVSFKHIGFWDLRFALADRYRSGRIFIAGDAAHSHPPYGGYGVNSGFEDARNLGWKLAAVLQGWGHDSLLDTYDLERRPVFASTIQDFIAKSIETDGEFLNAYDPKHDRTAFEKAWHDRSQGAVSEVHAFEPNYEGSPIIDLGTHTPATCSAKGSHQFKARAGHHLAPALLTSGQNIFEALGQGYTLLAIGTDAPSRAHWTQAADAAGLPLNIITEQSGAETDRYEKRWVLIRPDQFIAWSSDQAHMNAAQIQAVLQRIQG